VGRRPLVHPWRPLYPPDPPALRATRVFQRWPATRRPFQTL